MQPAILACSAGCILYSVLCSGLYLANLNLVTLRRGHPEEGREALRDLGAERLRRRRSSEVAVGGAGRVQPNTF
jgi:hypothetical protein